MKIVLSKSRPLPLLPSPIGEGKGVGLGAKRRVSVVSTSSTTGPLPALPEPVEGSSGDFSLLLSFGGAKESKYCPARPEGKRIVKGGFDKLNHHYVP